MKKKHIFGENVFLKLLAVSAVFLISVSFSFFYGQSLTFQEKFLYERITSYYIENSCEVEDEDMINGELALFLTCFPESDPALFPPKDLFIFR